MWSGMDTVDWSFLLLPLRVPLPANVSSSPTINLISLNKSIHYGGSIDRHWQNVYWWIIKRRKLPIGLLMQTTSGAATLLTMNSADELISFLWNERACEPVLISIIYDQPTVSKSIYKWRERQHFSTYSTKNYLYKTTVTHILPLHFQGCFVTLKLARLILPRRLR